MSDTSARIEACRIGFIGAGRLGSALAWSFARRGCRVAAVVSRSFVAGETLAKSIPGCRAVRCAQEVADACDLVFVTTPDGAIESTVEHMRWRPGMAVVHCSGATEVMALGSAATQGAMIGGFHPMQTFGDPEAAVASLPGCTITVEAEEPLNALLIGLAERLECRVNRLPAGARGRYHAAAGYGSQFINVLLSEATKIWQSWGGEEEDAVHALLPMIRGTLMSIERLGVVAGMPGPVSRGDVESVAKHVAGLRELDEEVLGLYGELCRRTIPMAEKRGGIDRSTAARLEHLLDGACPRATRSG